MSPPRSSPIIGILSHPGDGASGRFSKDDNASHIAASYVKFVASAGARVIPLIYNEPSDVLEKKLDMINGVIFTGGRCKSGRYFEAVKRIFNYTIKKNDSGNHFPLLAICLGFELLAMIVSEEKSILEKFNALDQASTLQFTTDAKDATLFQWFPPALMKKLSNECLVMQNHSYGISPATLMKNKKLFDFFKILTTSRDANNQVYVSTAQAHYYPVTALQWHPEKNAFEWGSRQIPHTEDAIQASQLVANFFVREARKSQNKPSSTRDVLDNLIYKYRIAYSGKEGKGFDEVYLFTK